ncbi:hypothetical protein BVY04_04545 [bacterium M21]|nr:hypothetical protein BVY04_04545 [bacterium M21]
MENLFTWEDLADVTRGEWLNFATLREGILNISTDTRTIVEGDLFLALVGERFDGHEFIDTAIENGASAVLVSRPIEATVPTLVVNDTLCAYHRLARYHRKRFPALLTVGITGSSGKTSSKEIIASVMRRHFGADYVLITEGNTNNQIGVPQNLLRLREHHRCAILEMGTNMPGEIEILRSLVCPNIAVLTNIGPVHLEGLGDLDGVAREKSAIFAGAQLAILPAEYAELPIVAGQLPALVMRTGFSSTVDVQVELLSSNLHGSSFATYQDGCRAEVSWKLHGQHMAMNAAAAFAIGKHLFLDNKLLCKALSECEIPGMRMRISEHDGVTWINDAYNANPDSMRALIDWLVEVVDDSRQIRLVLGDMLELGPDSIQYHQDLLTCAKRRLPDAMIIGVGPCMAEAGKGLDVTAFPGTEEASPALRSELPVGAIVALKGSRGMALEQLVP